MSPSLLPDVHLRRPQSASLHGHKILPPKPLLGKEIVNGIHRWEYDDWNSANDESMTLTKSALIYRLMRSRLEANLAKSISVSQRRSKKKILSSTNSS